MGMDEEEVGMVDQEGGFSGLVLAECMGPSPVCSVLGGAV